MDKKIFVNLVKSYLQCSFLNWVLCFFIATNIGFSVNAHAVDKQSIPAGWESYLDRPDILKIHGQELQSDMNYPNWSALKAAHFSFVAELLSLYSGDTQIYFLARDAEYLYDVARLVTENTVDFNRIHLLNVSRANMRDKNIKAYLQENGITEEKLAAGQKVLFVDTGFSGTIPRVLAESFSSAANQNLNTQMIVSANPAHPSSRVFLVHLNPSVNEQAPSGMHSSIVTYEHMRRYTDRSQQIVYSDGHYHPISSVGGKSDGEVSKTVSQAMMQDFRFEWQKTETKKRYQVEKSQFELTLKTLTAPDSPNKEKAIADLKVELEKTKNTVLGRLLEAQVRDILGADINTKLNIKISVEDLGLAVVQNFSNGQNQNSKKNELIKKYPEWAPVLENPDDKIPKLFAEQNWQMIGNLIDANVDIEINKILVKLLYDGPAVGIKKELQQIFIEKADNNWLWYLAENIFSQPHTKDMTDLIKLVIEKGNPRVLEALAEKTFSQPHSKDMTDLIKIVIEKADSKVLQVLAYYTFSQAHTKDMQDLIRLVIEKGDSKVLQILAGYTFSQPHTLGMKDLIRLVIEKANQEVLWSFAQYTFSQPHTKDMADLLKLVIEKGDMKVLAQLATGVFSKPHTQGMKDLIRLVIEKGDFGVLRCLSYYTFSEDHTKGMKDLIKLVIEKGNPSVWETLAHNTFSRPHASDMKDLIKLVIEKGDSTVLQALAYDTFSQPHTKDMKDLIKLVIENGDQGALRYLAYKTFSQPHTKDMSDLIKLVIEKGDSSVLQALAEYTFSQPHTQDMSDLMMLVIAKGDQDVLRFLAHYTFAKPHTKDMKDLIKLVIAKGDSKVLQDLANYTFSQPHTQDMKDLIKLVIAKGDSKVLQSLAFHTFSQPHTKDMDDLLRLVIEKGDLDVLWTLTDYTFAQTNLEVKKDLIKLIIEKGDQTVLKYLVQGTFSRPYTKDMKDLLKLVIAKGDMSVLGSLAYHTFSKPHSIDMADLLRLVIEKGDSEVLRCLAHYTFSQPHTQNMQNLLKLIIEKGNAEVLATLSKQTFTQAHTNTPAHQVMKSVLNISDPIERKKVLEEGLAKINIDLNHNSNLNSTSTSTSTSMANSGSANTFKPITALLKTGDLVKVQDRNMQILKKVGEGRRGIVFQVQAEDNKALYALKVAKNTDPDTLESLSKESEKAKQWQALKIPHAKVLVQEKEYVLKTWIEGTSGDEVIKKYSAGDQLFKPAAEYILKLVAKIRAQGAYIGDFRPANLVWNGKAWVIIDSGGISQGLDSEKANSKWSAADERGPKFKRRWKMELPPIQQNSNAQIYQINCQNLQM